MTVNEAKIMVYDLMMQQQATQRRIASLTQFIASGTTPKQSDDTANKETKP